MVQSSPTLLSVTGPAREYLLQEEQGQRHGVEAEDNWFGKSADKEAVPAEKRSMQSWSQSGGEKAF